MIILNNFIPRLYFITFSIIRQVIKFRARSLSRVILWLLEHFDGELLVTAGDDRPI
jgi:hypothetical protein